MQIELTGARRRGVVGEADGLAGWLGLLLRHGRITTNLSREWEVAFARVAVVGAVLGANLLFLRGTQAYDFLFILLGFALVYNAAIVSLLLRNHLNQAFLMAFALDNFTVFAGWWVVAREVGQANELWLILLPMLITTMVRLGSALGILYAMAWMGWLAWSTMHFLEPGSYAVEQLPIRLVFVALLAWISMRLVGVLEGERQLEADRLREIEVKNRELQAAHAALARARDELEARVEERTRELMEINQRLSSEVTRGEEAREALAAERERLAATLRSMGQGVIVVNRDGRIVLLNRIAEEVTEWGQGNAVGLPLESVAPSVSLDWLENVVVPCGESVVWEEEIEGSPVRTVEIHATPIAEGPEVGGWVLLLEDVTAERAAQQRLEQEGRLAALGHMAAGIAHDFNNLLSGIILSSESLQRRDDVPDSAKALLGKVAEGGQRAAQLTRQILDFSRQSIIQRQALDLRRHLQETFALMERAIPESIRISLEAAPGSYMVHADPTQLQQVVTNLAVNARDAMPEGGELRLRLGHVEVHDGERPPVPGMGSRRWVALAVSDTGIGIPEDVRDKIFEPFFTTKPPGRGTGLGLAQVYGIVKQHDGFITVDSQPGRGTTFVIYLPALEECVSVADEEEEVTVAQGNGEVLLLVEDDPLVLDVFRQMLETLNYQVLTATNGKEALAIYEEQRDRIALVLTDVTMPVMGGVELSRELRRRCPDVKVIALTGYAMDAESRSYLEEGMLEWIEKPPQLPRLAEALRRGLQGSPSAEVSTAVKGQGFCMAS